MLEDSVENLVRGIEARRDVLGAGTFHSDDLAASGRKSEGTFAMNGEKWAISRTGSAGRRDIYSNGNVVDDLTDLEEFDPCLMERRFVEGANPSDFLLILNLSPRPILTELASSSLIVDEPAPVGNARYTHLRSVGVWPRSTLDLYFDASKQMFVKADISFADVSITLSVDQVSEFANQVSLPSQITCQSTSRTTPGAAAQACVQKVMSFTQNSVGSLNEIQDHYNNVAFFCHPFVSLMAPDVQIAFADQKPDDLTRSVGALESLLHAGRLSEALTRWDALDQRLDPVGRQRLLDYIARYHQVPSGVVGVPSDAWTKYFARLIAVSTPMVGNAEPAIINFQLAKNVDQSSSLAGMEQKLLDVWASSCDINSLRALRQYASDHSAADSVESLLDKWAKVPMSGPYGFTPASVQLFDAIEHGDYADCERLLSLVSRENSDPETVTTLSAIAGLVADERQFESGDLGKFADVADRFGSRYRSEGGEAVGNGRAIEELVAMIYVRAAEEAVKTPAGLTGLVQATPGSPQIEDFWLTGIRGLLSGRLASAPNIDTSASLSTVFEVAAACAKVYSLTDFVSQVDAEISTSEVGIASRSVYADRRAYLVDAVTKSATDIGRLRALRLLIQTHVNVGEYERAQQIGEQLTAGLSGSDKAEQAAWLLLWSRSRSLEHEAHQAQASSELQHRGAIAAIEHFSGVLDQAIAAGEPLAVIDDLRKELSRVSGEAGAGNTVPK